MSTTDYAPRNYADADRILHVRADYTKRRLDSRKIANNTYLVRDGEAIAVVLHRTAVVVWTPDGRVAFNSGGWNTKTTRDRMGRYAPYGVRFWTHRGTAQFSADTGRHEAAGCQQGDAWFHKDDRRPSECTEPWHRGAFTRTGQGYSGDFRDGMSMLVADPGGTVRYDEPIGRHIGPPVRTNGRGYYDEAGYFGFTVYNPNGRAGHPPAVGADGRPGALPDGHPAEIARQAHNAREGGNVFDRPPLDRGMPDVETDAERLDRLEAGVARMRQWLDRYSREADRAELEAADHVIGPVRFDPHRALPAEAMPPAAPVWTPRDKR